MKRYDYLIVGAGFYGAVFAHEATRAGNSFAEKHYAKGFWPQDMTVGISAAVCYGKS